MKLRLGNQAANLLLPVATGTHTLHSQRAHITGKHRSEQQDTQLLPKRCQAPPLRLPALPLNHVAPSATTRNKIGSVLVLYWFCRYLLVLYGSLQGSTSFHFSHTHIVDTASMEFETKEKQALFASGRRPSSPPPPPPHANVLPAAGTPTRGPAELRNGSCETLAFSASRVRRRPASEFWRQRHPASGSWVPWPRPHRSGIMSTWQRQRDQ
jgi:hypothetical protein